MLCDPEWGRGSDASAVYVECTIPRNKPSTQAKSLAQEVSGTTMSDSLLLTLASSGTPSVTLYST